MKFKLTFGAGVLANKWSICYLERRLNICDQFSFMTKMFGIELKSKGNKFKYKCQFWLKWLIQQMPNDMAK